MSKKKLEVLSASIRKAINPPKRVGATARILDEVQPLPVVTTTPAKSVTRSDAGRTPVPQTPPAIGTPPVQQTPVVPMAAPVGEGDNRVSLGPARAPFSPTPGVCLTEVRGTTGIPNTILDSLFPQLEPFQQLVYLRLYRLSHGFRNDTCLIGLGKLAASCKLSSSSTIRAVRELEQRGLIRRLGAKLGGAMREARGNQFWVFRPTATPHVSQPVPVCETAPIPRTPAAPQTLNKENLDDDYLNQNHHQIKGAPQTRAVSLTPPVGQTEAGENHTSEKEKHQTDVRHFAITVTTYTQLTKNPWLETDSTAYLENKIDQVPIEKVKSVIQTVANRAGSRINSFGYFVKEIVAVTDTRSILGRRRKLGEIIRRVRETHVGLDQYSLADFVYDVKAACSREGVVFDNDLFNELAKR